MDWLWIGYVVIAVLVWRPAAYFVLMVEEKETGYNGDKALAMFLGFILAVLWPVIFSLVLPVYGIYRVFFRTLKSPRERERERLAKEQEVARKRKEEEQEVWSTAKLAAKLGLPYPGSTPEQINAELYARLDTSRSRQAPSLLPESAEHAKILKLQARLWGSGYPQYSSTFLYGSKPVTSQDSTAPASEATD